MIHCGSLIEDVLSATRERAFLVAPFIKQPVLHRLLRSIATGVSVTVFTRWRPDEIAAGVSDLEVFDEISCRPLASLWLCHELHAKYYRGGARVLVGSANLTAAALGWSPLSNLELLAEASFDPGFHGAFERSLASRSIPATAEVRARVERAAALIPRARCADLHRTADSESLAETGGGATWVPHMRHPELLYRAYAGRVAELTQSGREQAVRDLEALSLPSGLALEAFHVVVASLLAQLPVVVAVDGRLDRPRRFGEMRGLVGRYLASSGVVRDSGEAWQTLMRWMLLFLPERYTSHTARYSEIFSRRHSL